MKDRYFLLFYTFNHSKGGGYGHTGFVTHDGSYVSLSVAEFDLRCLIYKNDNSVNNAQVTISNVIELNEADYQKAIA